jgi:hypothetical protein
MFAKILKFLDFLPGKKTIISAVALLAATLLASQGIPVTGPEMVTLFLALIDNAYVIVSAAGVAYGLIMKFARKFQ